MPAGTYADPFILNGVAGEHSLPIVWGAQPMWDGGPNYPVVYLKVETNADIATIIMPEIWPDVVVVTHYQEIFDYGEYPEAIENGYQEWYGMEFHEDMWDGTPLYMVLIDWSQDWPTAPKGDFTLTYEMKEPWPVELPPATEPQSATPGTPLDLATGVSVLFGGQIHLNDDGHGLMIGTIADGGSMTAQVGKLSFDVDPPAILDTTDIVTYGTIFGINIYKTDLDWFILVEDWTAGFPGVPHWFSFNPITLATSPIATPEMFDAYQIVSYRDFDDGTHRAFFWYNDPGDPKNGSRVIKYGPGGNIVELGPELTPPNETSAHYYEFVPVPGLPNHFWTVWYDTDGGYGDFGSYIASRVVVNNVTIEHEGTPMSLPHVLSEQKIGGGNYSGLIINGTTGLAYSYRAFDGDFGYSANDAGDMGQYLDIWAIEPSTGENTFVERRKFQTMNHEGWVSTSFQNADVYSDTSYYNGPDFWNKTVPFNSVHYMFGYDETIQPVPVSEFGGGQDWTVGPVGRYLFTFDETGLTSFKKVGAEPLLDTMMGADGAVILDSSRFAVAYFGSDSAGGTSGEGPKIVVFTGTAPDLDGNFKAGDRGFKRTRSY